MDVYLASGNKHKVTEIQTILKPFGVTVHLLETTSEKIEPKEWPLEKVAAENAKRIAEQVGKPILVDDTGCFFDAYHDFPGAQARWSFERLGYKGLLKLLDGETRKARFRCAAAVCFPGEEPHVFVGEMKGSIAEGPVDIEKDTFPYERIFVIEGHDVPICRISKEEKHKHSHRGNAFRQVGEFLKKRKNSIV